MASTLRGAAAGLMLMLLRMVAGQVPAGRAGYALGATSQSSLTSDFTTLSGAVISSDPTTAYQFTIEVWVKLEPVSSSTSVGVVVGGINSVSSGTCTPIRGSCSNPVPLGGCSSNCSLSTVTSEKSFMLYCGGQNQASGYCGLAVLNTKLVQITTGPNSIPLSTWNHIAATFDSGSFTIYLNGTIKDSFIFSSMNSIIASQTLSIASRKSLGSGLGYGCFSGMLDEIRIWKQVRNPQQIIMDMLETSSKVNNLVYYWQFSEGLKIQNSTGNRVIVEYITGTLMTISTLPTFQSQPLVNGATYIDRPAKAEVSVISGCTLTTTASGSIVITYSLGVQGSWKVALSDQNPYDSIYLDDPPVLPAQFGIPQDATFGAGAAACVGNLYMGNCLKSYCDGATSCPSNQMIGSYMERVLTWTPLNNAAWVVPAGGFELRLSSREVPTVGNPTQTPAPTRTISIPSIFLFVQAYPEFISPTPGGQDTAPFVITGYIGEQVNFAIRVQQRNVGQHVDIVTAEDPGQPNLAVTSAQQEQEATPNSPYIAQRSFSWTPVCQQAGLARVLFLVTSREVPSLSISKLIHIDVVRPQPVIVNMSTSSREMRVGCEMRMEVQAADGSEETRTRNNSAYGQDFNFTLWRWENGTRRAIPLTTAGVSIGEAEWNQYNGTTGRLLWKPVRGQEGGEYELCVAVRDRCHVGVEANECVNMSIAKCQACLAAGDSLEGLARQYRTDFLSLYTFNVGLGNPDSVMVDRPINVGFLYRVKAGDTLDELGRTFFTDIGSLLEVNSDIAERNNVATQYWRGPTAVEVGNVSTVMIFPGEKLCVVSSVCQVDCTSSECKLR